MNAVVFVGRIKYIENTSSRKAWWSLRSGGL